MTHEAFFKAVAAGDIAGAYLFTGEEEHVKERALAVLRKKLLPEGLEALNETVLMNPPAGDIIAAAQTLPMMAERRLVIVRDSALLGSGKAAGEADGAAALDAYLDRLPDTASIVFYVRGKADGRKKLTAALGKKGVAVQFDPLGDSELYRWIAQTAKGYGKAIDISTSSLLAFTAGRELLTLQQEIAKLAAYAGARDAITREDIAAVVTPTLECTVFQMVDAIVAGKEADAHRLLKAMLENGEARIGILAMMARQYRNLLHLKLMQQNGAPQGEIQKKLGVPAFAMRRLTEQARGADAGALRMKLDLCVDTDYAIKSGRMREDAALERAIARLCG